MLPFSVSNIIFSELFFSSALIKWDNLKPLKKYSENSIFHCHNPSGIKLITRLRLGFSKFGEHKFRYSFQDALDAIWSFG